MKYPSLLVLVLSTSIACAQDTARAVIKAETLKTESGSPQLLSKKGEPILPQKGDWALGIDASPFFRYAGNIFNATTNNAAPTFDAPGTPFTIYGKYFRTDKSAYRAKMRIGYGSTTRSNYVVQDNVVVDPNLLVKDTRKSTSSTVSLAFGSERRRGSGRVQGFYGVEGMVMLSTAKDIYTYGNPMSSTFNSPLTTTDFEAGTSAATPTRLVESKQGTTGGAGVRGFVGAEIFIFPKLSIGGEIGWGLGFTSQADGTTVSERWDTGNSDIKRETGKIGGVKQFGIDAGVNSQLGMNSGFLTLMFHF